MDLRPFTRALLASLLTGGLGLSALLGSPGAAIAQDEPAPAPASPEDEAAARDERIRRAREKWETLSPGEKERLRRSFEEWKKFSEEKRSELKRRFDSLGGTEGARLVCRKLEEMRDQSPERMVRMRMQSEMLDRLVDRLVKGAPERARDALAALPPEARERVRRRVGHALLELGREAMMQAHATEEERTLIRDGTPEEKRASLQAMQKRISEEVLEPHRDELKEMPEDRRRVAMARHLEEAFWKGLRDRGEEIRATLPRVMQETGREGVRGKDGPDGRRHFVEGRDRFHRTFGIAPEDLGDHRIARALVQASELVPREEREAFLVRVRSELRRIRTLPEGDRDAALRAFMEKLRKP